MEVITNCYGTNCILVGRFWRLVWPCLIGLLDLALFDIVFVKWILTRLILARKEEVSKFLTDFFLQPYHHAIGAIAVMKDHADVGLCLYR